ncbi:MAG: flagellar export protein FliJ [Gammaproteobacteria bacterium]
MKRSERLDPIVRLAQRNESDAARRCLDSRRDLDGIETRLGDLRRARGEYLALLSEPAGMSGPRMREIRQFLSQLDAAIVQFEWQVQKKRGAFERQQVLWAGTRARTQALGNVVARHQTSERNALETREQREIDDRSARPRN